MKREIIRVEPLASYLEKYKAPTSTVTRHGDTIYVTGAPPFEPDTGEICVGPIERQTELVLEQLKLCVESRDGGIIPGENILKVNVYITCSRRLTKSIGGTSRRTRPRGFSSTSLPGTAGSTSR